MSSITVKSLGEGLSFGTRVAGITRQTLQDQAVCRQLNDLFQDRGLIVFEDVEPTPQMHVAISNVFGPLKDHPIAAVPRADQENMPGVIDMRCEPNSAGVVEIGRDHDADARPPCGDVVPRAVRVASAPRHRAPTVVLEPDSMVSHAYRQLAHHLLRELGR